MLQISLEITSFKFAKDILESVAVYDSLGKFETNETTALFATNGRLEIFYLRKTFSLSSEILHKSKNTLSKEFLFVSAFLLISFRHIVKTFTMNFFQAWQLLKFV